jgi:hypothetical protein
MYEHSSVDHRPRSSSPALTKFSKAERSLGCGSRPCAVRKKFDRKHPEIVNTFWETAHKHHRESLARA